MATLVLGAVGSALGGAVGGSILGLSGAAIGGMIGSSIGSVADAWLISKLSPQQRIEGARLDSLRVTSASEGTVIPRLFGRMRIGGTLIWATDFREEITERRERVSKFNKVNVTEYEYYASFAVALCEGSITGIGRIWADGKPMDMEGVTLRWYPGDEAQTPDPFIAATMGADVTPAYRGIAYVMFEELSLEAYGNRLPQLSFEVFRPLATEDTAEGLARAVTMIPGSGEFAYATGMVCKGAGSGGGNEEEPDWGTSFSSDAGDSGTENVNARAETADMVVSLDQLEAMAPAVESVSLVVSWFGDDLRAGDCTIRPKVELAQKDTTPLWSVNGVDRDAASVVSQIEGVPAYGGTPADFAVVQAIEDMKARGLRVTFYPFIMMDVPPGNVLPDPYSDNAAGEGQPAFPWRGRITCSPAAGFDGTVDKTGAAGAQVAAFFGTAQPGDFAITGTEISWTGGADWGFRRMILHYAHLCAAAGGVDAFLIGTEMRGLTQIRSDASLYPAVQAFRALAADLRAILGTDTKISYAADWSEYFGHQPGDGSGDVFFHLDPLWADPEIDFIGIDNYMPLSDWRDGHEHLDAQAGWPAVHDRAYLQANVAGGEGYDWYYASAADRAEQIRTPISDGAHGKPWVFRYKDLRAWWSEPHVNRPGGVESGAPTDWQPQSKPIWFTELGCPAVDRGTNQPNVFYDPKSSESFLPYFSRGWRDDAIQRAYLEATWLYWSDPANNPVSATYGAPMVHLPEAAAWTWDARPYPYFPALSDIWADGPNWRLGHWLTGRLGAVSLAALVRHLCLRAGLPVERVDVSGLWGAVEGYVIAALESPRASLAMLARHFGFDAVETGGVIRFVMRGRGAVTSVTLDDLVVADGAGGEVIELTRGQETELPQTLKWQLARADEDYDAAVVEAQRITTDATRVLAEAFPMAVPPEEAERRARRALMEAWLGRETAAFRLPPSRLVLDPGDVLRLDHDGRGIDYRLIAVNDAEARAIEGMRQDREVYDLPPGGVRDTSLMRPVTFGAPDVRILDLPQIFEDRAAHQPLIASWARPWPGAIAVWRSPGADGFELVDTFTHRAQMGVLVEDLPRGRPSLYSRAPLVVEFLSGTVTSVSELQLLGGANLLAIETPLGWELVQAGQAELIAPRRYRMSRVLRGQRGTEWAIADLVEAGARVVVIDAGLPSLPVGQGEIGDPWNYRVGPARRPITDPSYAGGSFTAGAAGLLPFAPVHLKAVRDGSGDVTLSWIRRDRALAADNWNLAEIPQSEGTEHYAIDILDGETVLRSLTASGPSALYTAAQQAADFGAPLAPGDLLSVRVVQISALVGEGFPRRAALIVKE